VQVRSLACPNCGGPLPRHARWTAVTCAYCSASVAPGSTPLVSRKAYAGALARAETAAAASPDDLTVGDARWRSIGPPVRGDISDVFPATRARRLTERAIVKLLRDPADADLFARQWEVLSALHAADAQGAHHFTLRLPGLVARGDARCGDGTTRAAIVLRAPPGFEATLDDVREAFPSGVDARHAVWMWRRLLEVLGWVHRSGWVHGAVLPQHVVLNAADHGAILVGWACAARVDERLPAVCADREAFYPDEVLRGGRAGVAMDLSMTARCVAHALGADAGHDLPAAVPPAVRDLVEASVDGAVPADAWRLNDMVAAAARHAFGPPAFVPFLMPPARRP
jgi:hypothetical protein